MLSLDLPTKPYWINLVSGARLLVRPLDAALDEAAQHHARETGRRLLDDFKEFRRIGQKPAQMLNLDDPHIYAGTVYLLLAQCLGRAVILDWEGVSREGKAASVTPDNVDELMRNPQACRAFLESILAPLAALADEGNGSGAAAAGISAAAPITAAGASQNGQARKRARKQTAPPAPTGKNRRARRKASMSGG